MGAGAVRGEQSRSESSSHNSGQECFNEQGFLSSTARPLSTSSVEMSCEGCFIRFTLLKRKKICSDCGRYLCTACSVKIVGGISLNTLRRCSKCQVILTGDFTKQDLTPFKVKDLRFFLSKKNIPIQTCTEKGHLVDLIFHNFANSFHRSLQQEHEQYVGRLAERMREANAEELRLRAERMAQNENEEGDPPSEGETEEERLERLRRRQEREMSETLNRLHEEFNETETEGDPRPGNVRAKLSDINTEEDINVLSVKQLKEVLVTNFVDYKGCCEKYELAERVLRLWKENQNSQQRAEEARKAEDSGERTDQFKEEDLCKICMDAPVECVLLECGHTVTCTKCGRRLAECPICRQNVVRAVRIFRS